MAMITLGDCSILTVVLSFNSFSITSIRQSFCSGSKLEKYNFFWLILTLLMTSGTLKINSMFLYLALTIIEKALAIVEPHYGIVFHVI